MSQAEDIFSELCDSQGGNPHWREVCLSDIEDAIRAGEENVLSVLRSDDWDDDAKFYAQLFLAEVSGEQRLNRSEPFAWTWQTSWTGDTWHFAREVSFSPSDLERGAIRNVTPLYSR